MITTKTCGKTIMHIPVPVCISAGMSVFDQNLYISIQTSTINIMEISYSTTYIYIFYFNNDIKLGIFVQFTQQLASYSYHMICIYS